MKKLIRLTEGDLHRIVKESVNRILNEIGDTDAGMYNLGRLQKRAQQSGNRELDDRLCDYYEKNWKSNRSGRAFNTGYDDQARGDKDTINQNYNAFKQPGA